MKSICRLDKDYDTPAICPHKYQKDTCLCGDSCDFKDMFVEIKVTFRVSKKYKEKVQYNYLKKHVDNCLAMGDSETYSSYTTEVI